MSNTSQGLILIANPGSASRKYALYKHNQCIARLYFEHEPDTDSIMCTLWQGDDAAAEHPNVHVAKIEQAAESVEAILQEYGVVGEHAHIQKIGLRIVAPSSFFLQHHIVGEHVVHQLEQTMERAPLHIHATLAELKRLRQHFPHVQVIGVSDSAFHITKPDRAWNYGIPLGIADQFDIKRFGYHGLSVASAVDALHDAGRLAARVVVCHLGGGASVTAVYRGKSFDTTMGYSPLEGVIMATRSGSVDAMAVRELMSKLHMTINQAEEFLNTKSGLLGLSGASDDIRELLELESTGNLQAKLALDTYVYSIQKAIGQMMGAMNGIDELVFTGTVGERSAIIRERIMAGLTFADLDLDSHANRQCNGPAEPVVVSRLVHSKPIVVVPADEASEMLKVIRSL